ncbi:hypothetical protein JKP88DRAFT_264829 [Tribonema minus]|uniref:Uncharacterized protein n=1 Tax=Tribonema minus TaxID=303371 RepID=A0A835YQT0_9STRA|nr:hypothetical protein JKP88DRAFT_264829 [Tribonema minus]
MVKGTYHPFTKAINSWLVTKGMSMKDLDNLTSVLAPKFNWNHDDGHHQVDASRFSEVPWVPELAQHLLDTGFNLFDCFNLELLVHIAVFSDCPMRDQDFWNNRASLVFTKSTGHGVCIFQEIHKPGKFYKNGREKGWLTKVRQLITVRSDLTRVHLIATLVCRSMRLLWQQSTDSPTMPVPDRVIGLAGSCNPGDHTVNHTVTQHLRTLLALSAYILQFYWNSFNMVPCEHRSQGPTARPSSNLRVSPIQAAPAVAQALAVTRQAQRYAAAVACLPPRKVARSERAAVPCGLQQLALALEDGVKWLYPRRVVVHLRESSEQRFEGDC